jgi:hypothetical protein
MRDSDAMAETSYTLRKIDRETWRKAKARAENDGRTMRWVLLQLIRAYAKHGERVFDTNGRERT